MKTGNVLNSQHQHWAKDTIWIHFPNATYNFHETNLDKDVKSF